MPGFLRPKNWQSFQHYRQRRPPWIKLHKILLDDYRFQCLSDASKALAPLLWLLASEYEEGLIPLELSMISFRVHITIEKLRIALKPLTDSGFFEVRGDASTLLAGCTQDATPEIEGETEAEGESETPLLESCDSSPAVRFQVRQPRRAELVYCEYPRKVGKRKALTAIEQAIKRLQNGEKGSPLGTSDDAAVFLVQRVKLFATSPKGQAGEFTPHPATWFNRSSYLDDEETWYERTNGNGHKKQQEPARNGDPNCSRCQGTGLRGSYSAPGRLVECECVSALLEGDGEGSTRGPHLLETKGPA